MKTNHNDEEKTLFAELAAPFPPDAVSFKPQTVSGNRALAVAYVDARCVMDRLDSVLGPGGWQDSYELLAGGCVKCELRVRVADEWITKSDAGSPGEQSAECDQVKSAVSDALKRAGVKWGIGRYLYRLPKQWLGYDPQRRQFTETPRLPNGNGKATHVPTPTTTPPQPTAQPEADTPRTAMELFGWLRDKERILRNQGLCQADELIYAAALAGVREGHSNRICRWPPSAIPIGITTAELFVRARTNGAKQPTTA